MVVLGPLRGGVAGTWRDQESVEGWQKILEETHMEPEFTASGCRGKSSSSLVRGSMVGPGTRVVSSKSCWAGRVDMGDRTRPCTRPGFSGGSMRAVSHLTSTQMYTLEVQRLYFDRPK